MREPTRYRACKFREWVEAILALKHKLFKRYADNMLAFNGNQLPLTRIARKENRDADRLCRHVAMRQRDSPFVAFGYR